MKTALTVLFLVVGAPAFAQESVVAKYRGQYPTPLGAENTVRLLKQVAVEVGGGLLKKPDGQSCGGYACDIICFADGRVVDILSDSDGAARPQWGETSNPRGYACELQTTAPGPGPGPTPPPATGADLTELVKTLKEISSKLDAIAQAIQWK